jgi:hypothetical protein
MKHNPNTTATEDFAIAFVIDTPWGISAHGHCIRILDGHFLEIRATEDGGFRAFIDGLGVGRIVSDEKQATVEAEEALQAYLQFYASHDDWDLA